jgi:hypothetical protein
MPIDLDHYLDLPEDPELQLVAFERLARENMSNSIRSINQDTHEHYVLSETREVKAYYANKLMAFHDAHSFTMLSKPSLRRSDDSFENEFDAFLDEVTYWTTQIEVRHANRLRPISTVLQLTPEIRQQLHSYINKIRETVAPLQLPEKKKEAILGKLNSLADEVDRDRTKTEAWTAFVLEIASAGGQAAKELKPIKDISDAIGSLLGKAKEIAEGMRRLPAPAPRARIEGPPKPEPPSGPSWDAPRGGDLDDEIPF